MQPQTYYRVLTVAGSDSGGGAGIQADLKTFAALGCYGMSAITALTAQNTLGVKGIFDVSPAFVRDQMDAVLDDIGADAVKIGMLFSKDIIHAVADALERNRVRNIVLDPVMAAQSGDKLLRDDAVQALRDRLMPMADIVTPNLPETEILLGSPVNTIEGMKTAARALAATGCGNILIKGGHLDERPGRDVLYLGDTDRFVDLPGRYVPTRNNHGTGCTLAAAIAAFMARGYPLEDAVREAKEYIGEAIRRGAEYRIGNGHGPVHHFWSLWRPSVSDQGDDQQR